MWAVLIVGVLLAIVVASSIIAARRGTEQVTTYGDAEVERERARAGGTGGIGY